MRAHDFVVVGSGFGGSVAACRLAEAGRDVVLIERGPRWRDIDFPSAGPRRPFLRSKKNWDGWLDLFRSRNMSVMMGNGLGGGSLIYANVTLRPRPECLADFPFPASELDPHFERAEAMLRANVHMGPAPPKEVLFTEAAFARGQVEPDAEQSDLFQTSSRVPQAVDFEKCTQCGDCDLGCRFGAKNTLDKNYLRIAEQNGCEIRTGCEVIAINPGWQDWVLRYRDHQEGREKTIHAKNVIFACGSVRTTELLLRANESPGPLFQRFSTELGRHWASNGDAVTFSFHRRKPMPNCGTVITSYIDQLARKGCVIQDGGLPSRLKHSRGWRFLWWLFRLDHLMMWFGQAKDESNGRWSLVPKTGELTLDWDHRPNETAINNLIDEHRRMIEQTRGIRIPFLPWLLRKKLVTPHPLGGCVMGRAVDGECRLLDRQRKPIPGLYVMDGSVIPQSVGINPSLTITAVAERAIKILLGRSDKDQKPS